MPGLCWGLSIQSWQGLPSTNTWRKRQTSHWNSAPAPCLFSSCCYGRSKMLISCWPFLTEVIWNEWDCLERMREGVVSGDIWALTTTGRDEEAVCEGMWCVSKPGDPWMMGEIGTALGWFLNLTERALRWEFFTLGKTTSVVRTLGCSLGVHLQNGGGTQTVWSRCQVLSTEK